LFSGSLLFSAGLRVGGRIGRELSPFRLSDLRRHGRFGVFGGEPGLPGRRNRGQLRNFAELKPGEIGVIAVRMLGEEGIQCVLVAKLQCQLEIPADLRLRRVCWRRCNWPGGYQRDIGTAERAINVGLLPTAGGLHDVVANESKGLAQIQPRQRNILHQCGGIRAVAGCAVERREAGLGGKGDQRVGRRRLDPGEATAYRP